MKEGWEYKKIDDISTIVGRIGFRGYTKNDLVSKPELGAITLSPSNIINGELSFEKCSYISLKKYEESPEIMLAEGDVVLVKTALIGKCSIVRSLPHKATLNPQFVVFKNIKIDNEYFNYYIKSPYFQKSLKTIVGGVAIPTLSQKKLGQLEIYFPTSFDEQRRIVSYLDSSFKLIDEIKNKALKSLTEAKALFQSALTEAMESKEGWEYKTLGEVVSFSRGLTYKKSDEVDYSTKVVLRSTNINVDNNSLNIDELKYLNENIEFEEEKLIKKGSILICMSNGSKKHLGKVALIEHDYKYAFGGFMGLLTPVIKINSKYLYYTLTTPKYKEYIKSLSEGANINNLKIKDIQKYIIPIFPLNEQNQIVSRLDKLSSKVRAIEEKYQKMVDECDALKQAMLRDVFE